MLPLAAMSDSKRTINHHVSCSLLPAVVQAALTQLDLLILTLPHLAYAWCRSKVEILKEQSDFLRHPLMEELVTEEPNINEGALQLMKFHGSYQQDDRDKRGFGKGKAYQFMMRTRQPAGLVSNQLYLTMDDLADQVHFIPVKVDLALQPGV